MNERFKELANEAFTPINDMASEGIADRHTFNMHWFQLYNQKFAELIVKECIARVLTCTISDNEIDAEHDLLYREYNKGVNSGLAWAESVIKDHFGVE